MKKSNVSFMIGAAAVRHMRHLWKPSADLTARKTSQLDNVQPYGTVPLQTHNNNSIKQKSTNYSAHFNWNSKLKLDHMARKRSKCSISKLKKTPRSQTNISTTTDSSPGDRDAQCPPSFIHKVLSNTNKQNDQTTLAKTFCPSVDVINSHISKTNNRHFRVCIKNLQRKLKLQISSIYTVNHKKMAVHLWS